MTLPWVQDITRSKSPRSWTRCSRAHTPLATWRTCCGWIHFKKPQHSLARPCFCSSSSAAFRALFRLWPMPSPTYKNTHLSVHQTTHASPSPV